MPVPRSGMDNRGHKLPLLLALVLFLAVPGGNADPDGFVSNTSLATTCTSHPASPNHYGHHRSPQQDSTISIVLLDSHNNAVQKVCPGATYQLQVSFPQPREFLITATSGNMSSADPDDVLQCTNRFLSYLLADNPNALSQGISNISLGCIETMPGRQLVVRVTSAIGEYEHHLQATASFPADDTCGVDECLFNSSMPSLPQLPPTPPNSPPSAPFIEDYPAPSPPMNSSDAGGNRACTASTLGYSCSLQPSGNSISVPITVHWSINTPPPANNCTGQMLSSTSASDTSQGVLHMAVEAQTSGYVGLGFATSELMTNSDVVFGWVNSAGPMVDVWYVGSDRYGMSADSASRPSWLTSKGISQASRADGTTVTTLCFSRPLLAPSATVSSVIQPTATLTMIVAAAEDGVTSFGQAHKTRAGFTLNPSTGQTSELAYVNKAQKMNIHGALMAVAWVLLIPLGSLVARHKWLLGESRVWGVHTWFQLHRLFQLSGMVLFIVGFAYAWQYLPGANKGDPIGGSVGKAHQVLGTIIMGLAGVQVILGGTRPKPDASWRPKWNVVHHNLGRLTMVSAWATIYLGIYIAHGSLVYQASYMTWLIPVAVVNGVMVLADVILTLLTPSPVEIQSPQFIMVGNDAADVCDSVTAAAEHASKYASSTSGDPPVVHLKAHSSSERVDGKQQAK